MMQQQRNMHEQNQQNECFWQNLVNVQRRQHYNESQMHVSTSKLFHVRVASITVLLSNTSVDQNTRILHIKDDPRMHCSELREKDAYILEDERNINKHLWDFAWRGALVCNYN